MDIHADNFTVYNNVSDSDTNQTDHQNIVFPDPIPNRPKGSLGLQNSPEFNQTSLNTTQKIAENTRGIIGPVPDANSNNGFRVNFSDEIIKSTNIQNTAGGTMTTITVGTHGSDQIYPSVFLDNLVWLDYRNGEQAVRLYNITTCREETISNKSPWKPSIYNDVLVYGIQDSYYGTYDINMYTISTGIELTLTPGDWYNQIDPAIFEDRIVYTDDTKGTRNIVLYNITTNETRYLTNDESGPEHMYPAIYGDWVAWYAGNEEDATLNLFHVATGNSTTIASNCKSFFQSPPSIHNDRLVWQEWHDEHYDIVMYNITTHEKTLITPGTDESDQKRPSIFGNYIVWDDNRDQSYGNENIYVYNLETNETSVITYAFPNAHRTNARVYGERIVWAENQEFLDYNIYLFTLGQEQAPVVSGFTVNATEGMVPFTVRFTDTSSGNPTSHYWNFGDGNESSDVNPVYTYQEAGHFSPALIVSNPYSRDYSVQEHLIVAGAVPVTKFTINPSSGLAPLSSTLTDLSSGYPDTWYWDFGDNSSSNEQNPSHVFVNPGNYIISLTTGNQFGNNTAIGYVHVIKSTEYVSLYTIPGIVQYSSDTGFMEINTSNGTGYSFELGVNNTQLFIIPQEKGMSPSFTLVSRENTTFSSQSPIISGIIEKLITTSEDISSAEFSDTIGDNSWVNYTFEMPQYYPEGSIKTSITDEITPEEHEKFNITVQDADYGDYVSGVANSMYCIENNMSVNGPATVVMAVSHEWVVKHSPFVDLHDRFKVEQMNNDGSFTPLETMFAYQNISENRYYYVVTSTDGIDLSLLYIPVVGSHNVSDAGIELVYPSGFIYENPHTITVAVNSDWVVNNDLGGLTDVYEPVEIIRVGDLGSIEVLETKFLYYDETRNVDVFEGISPNGLSQFTLVTVGHYTNPLQMLYLSLSIRVPPPVPASNPNSGGGGGGGSYGGSGNQVTQAASEPAATKGSQSGTVQEGTSGASSGNNREPNSLTTESVAAGQPSASPVPRVSNAPAANPPVLPPQPTNSIFTMLIEAAAIVSIFVLVVFSIYTRNRKLD